MKCPNCSVELLGSMKKCPKCGYDTQSGAIDQSYLDSLAESRKIPEKYKEPGVIARCVCNCCYNGKNLKNADVVLRDEGTISVAYDFKTSGTYTTVRAAFGLLGAAIYKASYDSSCDSVSFPVSSILTVTDSQNNFTKGGYRFELDDGRALDACLNPAFFNALIGYMGVI